MTTLRANEEVVAVAGGEARAGAVRAALTGGYANSLGVDSSLATALLAYTGS